MDARVKDLLTRLTFFAQDGMTDKPIVEIAKQADALLTELVKQQNTQQPVAWMLECPTMTGDTCWKLSWNQSGAGVCNRLSGKDHEKALYTAPPVPRDVLVLLSRWEAFGKAMLKAGSILPRNLVADTESALADRYASQVQTERQSITPQQLADHLASGGYAQLDKSANQPEPVNQQMLAALKLAKNSLVAFKLMPGQSNAWEYSDESNLAAVDAAIAAAEAAKRRSGYCGIAGRPEAGL